MKPSAPRGLPAPRSNAAARSRNSPQYTQRLSIQNEVGFRFTDRCRRVRESSFLRTCHWGGCSKMVLTFRGYVRPARRSGRRFGWPMPAEHAFATHREAVLVRRDELQEQVEVVVADVGVDQFLALAVHDADVHLARMEIDSAVELGRGGVILHTLTQ